MRKRRRKKERERQTHTDKDRNAKKIYEKNMTTQTDRQRIKQQEVRVYRKK